MKHLLNGVAVAAALVIAAPVWAQNPSGGNAVGTPGPNPGGPGLTPYSTGAPPPAATAPPPGASTSATPPMHRHPHAMHHPMHARAMHKAPSLAGDTTAQLNGEELARIQAGNFSNPPPAAPMPEGPGSPKSLPGPKSH